MSIIFNSNKKVTREIAALTDYAASGSLRCSKLAGSFELARTSLKQAKALNH